VTASARPLRAVAWPSVQPVDGPGAAARAESIELALVAAYDALLDLVGDEVRPILETNRAHHRDHARGFADLAGDAATGDPDAALVESLAPQLDALGGQGAALAFARELEDRVAATHAHAITVVDDRGVAQDLASVLAVEAAHAASLRRLLGEGATEWFPDGAFEPTDPARGFTPQVVPPG
jgi:hypothetical protein